MADKWRRKPSPAPAPTLCPSPTPGGGESITVTLAVDKIFSVPGDGRQDLWEWTHASIPASASSGNPSLHSPYAVDPASYPVPGLDPRALRTTGRNQIARIKRHVLAVKPHQLIRRMAHMAHEIARADSAVMLRDHFKRRRYRVTSSAVTITGPKLKNVSILFARVR